MRTATLKFDQMRNFKNSNGLLSSYGSMLYASMTLGAISIVAGFADYPSGAGGRVSLVLLISGLSLSLFSVFNLKNLKNIELNKPSEVFTFSFYFILIFIAFQSALLLASGVVDTIDVAILESASGITTTAISTLNPETLPTSIKLSRSLTQWVGGLGALFYVFVATPISSSGDNPSAAYAPKIFSRKPLKRMQEISILYIGLTICVFAALNVAGMGLFDSFAHSLTTSSTGGFSTKVSSISSFQSGPIEWVLICAMFLGGLNLGIIWWIGRKKLQSIKSNNELRLYLVMFFGGAALFWLKGDFVGPFDYQVRDAFFKVSSLLSTTGYTNTGWEFSSGISAIALLLLATGGMAGSPGSGFGVHRLIELIKYLRRELTRKYNRQAIRKIKVSGEVVNERELDKLQGYTAIFIFIIATGSFLLSLDSESLQIEDSIAVSLSAFVTAGPPITEAGLTNEYGILGNSTLSVLMVVGRLSILPAAYMVLKLSQTIKLNFRGLLPNEGPSDEIL
tara:strand:+ start:20665 stop:22188 length:1524 start_codon:yes stop_codon:yes gene_type:complete